ncbi:hypothetical protein [Parathermosynechococcus lividus]
MAISYQSRFFLFWRRQWQHWQHQWQRQRWQVESTLSGVVQVIAGLLSQVWQQGLPQLRSTMPRLLHRLRPASSPPAADLATQAVTAALALHPQENHTLMLHLAPLPRRVPWWQRLFSPVRQPTPETALGQRQPFYLACDVHARSLMLVDTAAVPLKIFTPQEQQQIEQRIYYELACYYQQVRQWYRRHHRGRLRQQNAPRQCLAGTFLNQLTVTATVTGLTVEVPALSPLAQLWQRWQLRLGGLGQRSLARVRVQGIASQLQTGEMVLIGSDNSILYTLTPQQRQRVLAWIEQHLNPSTAILPLYDWLSRASYWLAGLQPPSFSAATSPLLAATDSMPARPNLLSASLPSLPTIASPPINADPLIVEVEAAFVGYELHWLEKLLLWCDRLLLWLETQLIAAGRWLLPRLGLPAFNFFESRGHDSRHSDP